MISGLQFGGGCVELGGLAEEEAVGQGAANAVLKEDEHQGGAEAFIGQAVGITVAVSLKQGMGFELAEVVTELGERISFVGELEGRKDGLIN